MRALEATPGNLFSGGGKGLGVLCFQRLMAGRFVPPSPAVIPAKAGTQCSNRSKTTGPTDLSS